MLMCYPKEGTIAQMIINDNNENLLLRIRLHLWIKQKSFVYSKIYHLDATALCRLKPLFKNVFQMNG